jgi:hypothetical protein
MAANEFVRQGVAVICDFEVNTHFKKIIKEGTDGGG